MISVTPISRTLARGERLSVKAMPWMSVTPAIGVRFALVTAIVLSVGVLSSLVLAQSESNEAHSSRFDLQIESLVERLAPSLITVQVVTPVNSGAVGFENADQLFLRNFSAVVIDSSGLLLAAASTTQGEDSMFIVRQGKVYSVWRVGVDYRSGLALLKTGATDLLPAPLASQQPKVGAISLFLRATKSNTVEPIIAISSGNARIKGYLEFNGPVGSETVGGAFFDMSGNLLGYSLGSLSDGSSANRSYAVSASRIEPIVSRLKCCGDRVAGYLGVQAADTEIRGLPRDFASFSRSGRASADQNLRFTALSSESMNTTSSAFFTLHGALITVVEPNSPAAASGLDVGDVIYSYDGQPVISAASLRDYVMGCRPDSVITVDILRNLKKETRTVWLTSMPLRSLNFSRSTVSAVSAGAADDKLDVPSLLRRLAEMEKRIGTLERDR